MTQHDALDLAVSISGKTCITGSVAALTGWAASINWLGVIGVIVAVLSLCSQIYFNIKRDKREMLEHRKRMES